MEELLAHPAVQGGVAPFVVGLGVATLAVPLRLSGLGAIAGFLAAVFLIGNFSFETLTATRKVVVLGMLAPVIGLLADLAFKPTRSAGVILGTLFGAASAWVFWTVLVQKPLAEALVYGAGISVYVLWCVAFTLTLHAMPIRAGAVGLAMGLGVGIGAVLGASALIGQYGLALGAACGGFLLVVMLLGKRVVAGTSLTLTVSVLAPLLAAAAMLLAKLPWYSLAVFALVPIVARLPLPERTPPALQVVVASLYTCSVAAGACALAWLASRSGS